MTRRYALLRNFALILGICTGVSCKKDPVEIPVDLALKPFKLEVPSNFPAVEDDKDNPLTEEGVALGRLLFYDVRLSGNNRISCASCHKQELAFSDGLALTNVGVSGKSLLRHAPVLFNLAWANHGLFWDGGSTNLESQAFGPLTSPDEMNQDLLALEAELKQVPDYQRRFKQVFKEEIKAANVVKALAQFQRTLISGNSKYDKYVRREAGATLSADELQGLSLVNTKCAGCHSGSLFTDDLFHNNGLDAVFSDAMEGIYQGRFRVTFLKEDLGKFKTPSLRNVMITAPYMHDGRFKTIEEVLDHYSSGAKASVVTDLLMYQDHGRIGIPLTAQEKTAIKAFLSALTDVDFIKNKKISNPYQ